MPGVGSQAECPCGFKTYVRHGVARDKLNDLIVVCYSVDGKGLISLHESEAKEQGLEYISSRPDGPGYRCPSCGEDTLFFTDTLNWD